MVEALRVKPEMVLLVPDASLSVPTLSPTIPRSNYIVQSALPLAPSKPINLRFCGLRREAFGFSSLSQSNLYPVRLAAALRSKKVTAALSSNGSALKSFDYDLLIIGAGVGGYGAALHVFWILMRDCGFELGI